ncbi:MAG: aldolase [Verrucomicrobia bacterium]|nr:aldolase [Verrucomicrobiota bacterium]
MKMRHSRVLAKLRAGQVASCFKMNLADARAVEIAAMAGIDCVWLDMEHVSNDLAVIEKGIWAAKSQNVDVMVRVSRGSYSDYIRPLEMDAAGIMVPHVMGLADAQNVVRMTRFHPIGLRPVDGGNADGAYCGVAFMDYLKQANEQRFVVVQIEDPEPLAELDAIAALPGLDMLFFGPGDFSHAIGAPGAWNHPRLLDASRRVAEAAVAHGKFAGTVGSAANLDELIAMGYRFVSVGADVAGLSQYCKGIVAEFTKRPVGESKSIYGGK